METLLKILLTLFSVLALLKPLFFFGLSYDRRRAALDRSYGGRASATRISDRVLLGLCLLLTGLLAARGTEPVSFLTGLLVGMTLIQLYFHRFSAPLADDEAPPPPVSPIKTMSYAIQAAPGRPWKEMIVIAGLLIWSLYRMIV